ncbi:MAG: AMP-binding protein, partial [Gammaproteobacteria bacterium]
IAVMTDTDAHVYAAILAIMTLGYAYVPLNRKNPIGRNLEQIELSDPALLLATDSSDDIQSLLDQSDRRLKVIYTSNLSADRLPSFAPVGGNDLAYLFFTSGSTGKPKGVPIQHRNLGAFLSVVLEDTHYQFSEQDRFLQMFELTFDLSVMSFLVPMCVGGCCYIVPDSGVQYINIVRLLQDQKITVALMVPSVLSYAQRFFGELKLPELRISLFCGEALQQDLTARWAKCVPNASIRNVYGPTEATIFCSEFDWEERESERQSFNGVVPIGRPMSGMDLKIVDADGQIAEAGEQGELYLLGGQVAAEYWNDPERTASAFVELEVEGRRLPAYRTGDIAYVNDLGNFIYCGRVDSQIQIDGHRVELGEVEHCAREHVQRAAVASSLQTNDGRQEFVLFVESAEDLSSSLAEYIRGELPSYFLPRAIVCVERFPLNLSGKVDRKALLSEYLSAAD